MKSKLLPLLFACFGLFLAGCASVVAKLPDAEAKAAAYPPIPDYERMVKAYFASTLKDPYSAQYSDWFLHRAYLARKGAPVFSYVVAVQVNAKNSYGGYTGKQMHMLWLNPDGRVQDAMGPMSWKVLELVDIVDRKP